MTVRREISRRLFRKNRALRYPANCVVVASGAPSDAAATRAGVHFLSVATDAIYAVQSSGTSATVGVAAIVHTASAI